MSACAASIEVEAPPEAVFDLLHDYDRRLQWDPFLRRARVLGGAPRAGVGVRTYCAARWRSGGLGMETVYVRFRRPHVAAVKMTRGPWFLSAFAASLRQAAVAPGRTRVTYKFWLRARPRRFLEPLLRRAFLRETERRLRALAGFLANARG